MISVKRFILVVLVALAVLQIAAAQTYYVATNGNDSNVGNESQPWLTPQKAADTMTAGDTVYVKSGSYTDQLVITTSGTAGNLITYSAYPGHENLTIFEALGSGYSWDDPPWVEGAPVEIYASYINFSGFRVQNSNMVGIRLNDSRTNVTLYNLWIYNTTANAIAVKGNLNGGYDGANITIDTIDISQAVSQPSGGYGEIVTMQGVSNGEIKNVRIYNSVSPGALGGEGVDVSNSIYVTVHDNSVTGLDEIGIYIDGYRGNNSFIDVYNNVVFDIADAGGIAVANEVGGLYNGKNKNITIYNNVVWNVTGYSGIAISDTASSGGTIENTSIHSNTLDNEIIWIDNSTNISNTYIRNNVVSEMNLEDPGVITENNHNTTYDGAAGFIDAAANNYHLKPTSPLINTGTATDAPALDYDGNTRPQDGLYDIGAFEFTRKVINQIIIFF